MTVLRKDVDAKHPDWLLNRDKWANIALMYAGGDAIRRQASRFLAQRPKEVSEVYQARLDQFTYENNMGSGLGWFEAQMFESAPKVQIKLGKVDAPATATEFYTDKFLKDCDNHGTAFFDMYHKVFSSLLLYQEAYISVDLPTKDESLQTLQQQREAGQLDPYTCVLCPLDVINWDTDKHGNLLWAVVYSATQEREFLKPPVNVERWYWYDRQNYRVYESRGQQKDGSTQITGVGGVISSDLEKQPVELVDQGLHPLSTINQVPLQRVCVPAGWYMGDRAYLPALEHINISNVLKWSLFMAALAVPVMITDDEISSVTVAENSAIKLGIGSSYTFAEPSGVCWKELADRARTLKEEIYREMYLVAQSRTTSATASAQSGVSKQQDMKPSNDVLNGLGGVLRSAMKQTLERVASVRAFCGFPADAELTFNVQGFTFEDKLGAEDLAVMQDVAAMDIPSETFEKELECHVTRLTFPDQDPEVQAKIEEEIKAAPVKAERDLQAKLTEADAMQKQMTATMGLVPA